MIAQQHNNSAHVLLVICLATVSLSGCAQTPPPVTVVYREAKPIHLAPECDPSHDPSWQELPETDVTRSQAAHNYRSNKLTAKQLGQLRRVCWASAKPYTVKP